MRKSIGPIKVSLTLALGLSSIDVYAAEAANTAKKLEEYGLSFIADAQNQDFDVNAEYVEIADFFEHSEENNCQQLSSSEIFTEISQNLATITRPELDKQKLEELVLDLFPAQQYRVCNFQFYGNPKEVEKYILVHTGEREGVLFDFWQNLN